LCLERPILEERGAIKFKGSFTPCLELPQPDYDPKESFTNHYSVLKKKEKNLLEAVNKARAAFNRSSKRRVRGKLGPLIGPNSKSDKPTSFGLFY
jgi:hypothetical protein